LGYLFPLAACRNSVASLQRFAALSRHGLVTPDGMYIMARTCRKCGAGVGAMGELVGRLVADLGVDRATAEQAVGIISDFLVQEGPSDTVRPRLARQSGAEALMRKAADQNAGGFDTASGVIGAGMRMMAAGLSMGEVQSIGREVIAFAREKAGADVVGATVAAIPGLCNSSEGLR
jgi:hypothetical protein